MVVHPVYGAGGSHQCNIMSMSQSGLGHGLHSMRQVSTFHLLIHLWFAFSGFDFFVHCRPKIIWALFSRCDIRLLNLRMVRIREVCTEKMKNPLQLTSPA